ncbi:MAG TPA: hypothetical protein VJ941_05270, partial [Gracilimonas sp.]|nr:hypothetical protein [Gracilimonas sp.]
MKLYDRKEISAILKKATENSLADDPETRLGLSLDELRQIGSEVGIDPKQIERAVEEIEMDSSKSEASFWGGPFYYSSQVLVDGEISVSQWEQMLFSIRGFFQSKGTVTTRESVFEWSSPWGTTNSAQVTALKDKGKTKLSVNWSGPLTAIPFYIPVPIVTIASIFFASEFLAIAAVPGLIFTVLATGLSFLAGRYALRKHLNKGFEKLKKMVSELELIAGKETVKSELDI